MENAGDLIDINLKKDINCLYQLHADGNVSLDLDFKAQSGYRLLGESIIAIRKPSIFPRIVPPLIKICSPLD